MATKKTQEKHPGRALLITILLILSAAIVVAMAAIFVTNYFQNPAEDTALSPSESPTVSVSADIGDSTDAADLTDTPVPTGEVQDTPITTNVPETQNTPAPTNMPDAQDTPAPTNMPDVQDTPVPTNMPESTASPAPTSISAPTVTPAPTAAPTKAPSRTPTPVPTKKPVPTPTKAPSAAGGRNTSVSENGRLQVIGTRLCNQDGEEIVLHGISTAGIAWFPQLATAEYMRTLRDEWQTDVFRIAMYSFEGNDSYLRNPSWNLSKVCSLIDAAIELDQYVIVDWHILADGNPQTNQTQAIQFFTDVASRYPDCPNILYEICNEPNGGVSWSGNIKPYAQQVIPVIRSYSPNAVIIVGTPTWSQDVDAAAADPLDFDNLMYALHFYAGTHKEWLRSKAEAAMNKGLALFVTEWGTTDASGNGTVDKASSLLWLDFLDKYHISWCNWSLCNKAESSALLLPSAAVNGTMPDSALTESGKFVKEQILARSGNSASGDDTEPDGSSAKDDSRLTPTPAPGETTKPTPAPALPSVAPKPTANPSGTSGELVLLSYNECREDITNTISPRLLLRNDTGESIALSSIELRYYYTPESDVVQKLWCDYADVSGVSYRAITDSVSGEYLRDGKSCMRLSFSDSAGILAPGDTATLQLRITNEDWSNYSQSNDASFCPDASAYADSLWDLHRK